MPAQDDEQVADHRGPALGIEFHHLALGQHLQGMFNHPHRSGHDLCSRGDDGPGLLPLEHRGSDLAGIGEVLMRASSTSTPACRIRSWRSCFNCVATSSMWPRSECESASGAS